MREQEFRDWLTARRWNGQPLTTKAINHRLNRLKRVNRSLVEMGYPANDIDEVRTAGKLPDLIAQLRAMIAAAPSRAGLPATLVPQAENPAAQLRNLLAVTRQYGRFADESDGLKAAEQPPIEGLREAFLDRCPDFESFEQRSGAYWETERRYKDDIIAKVGALIASSASDQEIGKPLYEAMMPNAGPLLRWQTRDDIERNHPDLAGDFFSMLGELARSRAPVEDAIMDAVGRLEELRARGADKLTPGEIAAIAFTTAGCARPFETAPIKIEKARSLGRLLLGDRIFVGRMVERAQVVEWQRLLADLQHSLEQWGWAPQDFFDVQGFAWVALDARWNEGDDEEEDDLPAERGDADRIRQFALAHYIAPARREGRPTVTIVARDIHDRLALENAFPNVCQALAGSKFRDLAGVATPVIRGPQASSTTEFTYRLSGDPESEDAMQPYFDEGPFWFVGSSFGRTDDQTERFLREGIWQIDEPSDRHREQVRSMQPGQRIAIKATFVQLKNVPFDNRGRYVSVMRIKATGTIRANLGTGDMVQVEWDKPQAPRDWYFYTYQATVWEVAPDNEMSRRLIRFAFDREPQDIGWFIANLPQWQETTAPEPEAETTSASRMRDPVNLILFGPPGTGKTYRTMAEAVRLCDGLKESDELLTDPTRRVDLRARYEQLRGTGQIGFVTFHQNYGYEDFVEGLRPKPLANGVGFTLEAEPGVFRRMVDAAEKSPEEHVLVIDEINRANISKVFGELITLIERDKRIGMDEQLRLTLPYSNKRFGVPANLHIVGTMNTADRSIALLDLALRRRFVVREIGPRPEMLPVELDGVRLRRILEVLNDRIEFLVDREHRIGHGFFMACQGRRDVDAVMRDKVIPLLQEYFFEDWSRLAIVLGEREGRGGAFLSCRMLKDPTAQGIEDRPSWRLLDAFAPDAYDRLIGAVETPPEEGVDAADDLALADAQE